MKKSTSKIAFSLIELSVVILIIGILVIGISKGTRIIRASKLRSAQSLTMGSPVNSTDGILMWVETTLDKSFVQSEAVDTPLTSNGTISIWNDINPQGQSPNSPYQNTSNDRPRYVASLINGLPALNFDGVSEFMNFNGKPLVNSDYTFFVVEQIKAAVIDGQWFIGGNSGGANNDVIILGYRFADQIRNFQWNNECSAPSIVYSNPLPRIHTFTFNSSNGKKYYSNGTYTSFSMHPCTDPNAPLASYNSAMIAAANGVFYPGNIGEIIIFNRALKDSERSNIEKYLKQKWGVK